MRSDLIDHGGAGDGRPEPGKTYACPVTGCTESRYAAVGTPKCPTHKRTMKASD